MTESTNNDPENEKEVHRSRPRVRFQYLIENSEGSISDSDEVNISATQSNEDERDEVAVTSGNRLTLPDIENHADSEPDVAEVVSPPIDFEPLPPPSQHEISGPPSMTMALAILNDWANKWKVQDDPYLQEVNRAVRTRDDLTTLAAMDPLDLLPVPRREFGGNLMRIAKTLIVVRNIIVFAPVALTWLAINASTSKFGEYLSDLQKQAPEEATQASFLGFWQNGYGYLDNHWRIQNVAFLAALIIVGIIGITFLSGSLQAAANRLGSDKELRMERERLHVALKLAQALHGNKTASPQSISEALALVLNDLTQATKGVLIAAIRIESASVGVGSLSPHLQTLNQQVSNLTARFGQDVVSSLDALVKSVDQLGVAVGGDVRNLLTDVLLGLEEVNDRLNKTSIAVEYGTKQLREDLDAIHTRLVVPNSRQ